MTHPVTFKPIFLFYLFCFTLTSFKISAHKSICVPFVTLIMSLIIILNRCWRIIILFVLDSNGTSLVTQMNIKAAVSLSHPLSSCYNKNTVTKTESLLWMENQPGVCMSGNQTNQSKEKANSEYDKVSQQLPEYAEVTSSRVNGNEWNTSKTASSPAAYASVTLVANTRQCVSSLVSEFSPVATRSN